MVSLGYHLDTAVPIDWESQLPCLAHPCSWYHFADDSRDLSLQFCKSCCRCEIYWADGLVMNCWMVFRHIISKICRSCSPVCSKLSLICSASEPMKSHVHCLQFFQYIVVYHPKCRGVVDLDWGWWLWVVHFLK